MSGKRVIWRRFSPVSVTLFVLAGGFADASAIILLPGLADSSATGESSASSSAEPVVPSLEPVAPATGLDVPRSDSSLANQAPTSIAPARIRITDLGIDQPVDALGLDSVGALDLPANPEVASWYRYGPSPTTEAGPGTSGATVIAAHVDSLRYGLGPFAALAEAAVGTEVVVTGEDGSETTYRVDTVTSSEKMAVDWNSVFDRSGPPRLTLVTCGGAFDTTSLTYDSNVIVSASPVS
jgi:hypothetical protein